MLEWLAGLSIRSVLVIVGLLFAARRLLLRAGSLNRYVRAQAAETAETIGVAMVMVFLVLHRFVFQLFFIPSESMLPTLQVHDRILVNRFLYRFRPPQRQEIIVFRAPEKASREPKDFIKRLIGLPGETVAVVPDRVTIDGRPFLAILSSQAGDSPISEPALQVSPRSRLEVDGGRLLVDDECVLALSPTGTAELVGRDLYVAGVRVHTFALDEDARPFQLPVSLQQNGRGAATGGWSGTAFYRAGRTPFLVVRGRRLAIEPGRVEINGRPLTGERYLAQTPRYRMPPLHLGPDEYFVLGDNRNQSLDSHYWGPLKRDAIVGKAWAMFWPLQRAGLVN